MFDMKTATIKELSEMLKSGVKFEVTLKPGVADLEGYPEAGMRTSLTGIQPETSGVKIYFDFTKFDEYNRNFESGNYYDKAGNATLTARAAGEYKYIDWFWFDFKELASTYFEVISTEQMALLAEYTDSRKEGQSYNSWLESLVLELRANGVN